MNRLPARPTVAVVGATGAVGRVMLDILYDRQFPASQIVAVASARSAGRELGFADRTLTVKALERSVFEGIDLVLLDTPDEVAAQWGPIAVEMGAVVVDNSAAWRADPEVPLVVPEANAGALEGHRGIIASPNCVTIGVVVPIAPLHRRFGLSHMVVSTYQATSGAGKGGVEELAEQSQKLVHEMDALAAGEGAGLSPAARTFVAPIAFNVLPAVGRVKQGGSTSEELKLLTETRKIMSIPDLQVHSTCVRVPVVVGHGSSVMAHFARPVDLAEAIEILANAPGVSMDDVPNPMSVAGMDDCVVGRVRSVDFDPNALSFFTVSDNLRKGAALNTVQIAELLLGE
ncbi:MAG: aspartate-semialdehyde dehydrogenase [Actinomycetota bacterium]